MAIINALVQQLQNDPGRITTKSLARALAITESALYRHFASKRDIFAALIEQIGERLEAHSTQIIQEGDNYLEILHHLACVYLRIGQDAPGCVRVMLLLCLEQEDRQLVVQMNRILERFETRLRQLMRDMEAHTNVRVNIKHIEASGLLMSCLQGILWRFLYAPPHHSPVKQFDRYWPRLTETVFSVLE